MWCRVEFSPHTCEGLIVSCPSCGGEGQQYRRCVPWHKPWAESAWLGCSVSPLCTPSQERNPEPSSGTLHLSVEMKPIWVIIVNTSHYMQLACRQYTNMCMISHFQGKDLGFFALTLNPLYRILPLKTGNTTTCIINGLCSNCSHRQWYHFLISWLDEACQWAGLCTSTAAHWPWKDAMSSGIRPIILGLPLILTAGMEPWLIGWFLWVCSLGSAIYTHRSVTVERSLISSRGNVGVCPIEQLRL